VSKRDVTTDHFTARAERYNRSSHWCTDSVLMDKLMVLLEPGPGTRVLDVACGTGLVSRVFTAQDAEVTGLDITEAMYEQARPHLRELVVSPAEDMPFEDGVFDISFCRQGIQFMDAAGAVQEMVRVTRPGGRVCLVHLTAYGEEDKDEYFEVLRLRNPARRNFFLRSDLEKLLTEAGCVDVAVHSHVSPEDVDAWSDNGAITEEAREGIREVYRAASPTFQKLHAVATGVDGRFVDHMLFGIAIGSRPR